MNKMLTMAAALALAAGVLAEGASEPLALSPMISDGMVLAAYRPVRVFGTGQGKVRVAFRGKSAEVTASGEGAWCAELPGGSAGGPFEMRITLDGRERIVRDVQVGAVVLFAGQSNLQFKLRESSTPKGAWKGDARIRSFTTTRMERGETYAPTNGWVTLTAANAGGWSAVAYETATRLAAKLNIAVGVVNCYQGASTIQAWMDPAETAKACHRLPDGGRLHGDHAFPVFARWNQPHGKLYNLQFRAVAPFAFTDVVWYQGESNTGKREGEVYAGLLGALMQRWRQDLREDDLPFVIVQLADYDPRNDADWKAVQKAQVDAAAKDPHAVLVRAADVCESDNIHPKTKSRLGARIAEAIHRAGTGSGFGWPEVRTNELTTAWGRKLTPANAWREYPRPQMVREGMWQSLNGTWDLTIEPSGRKAEILVPFPVESQLSGVRARVQPTDELVYRRTFVARRRAGFRTLLNFEAVDFRAQVFVNGIEALDAPHEGGCVPFSVDVTDLLAANGENKLEVRVWDPTDTFINSTGKQTLQIRTCFFPPSSGIIGSVWTEEAPETYLEGYRVTADPDTGRVVVTPFVKGDLRNARVKVEVLDKPGMPGWAIVSGEQTRSDRPVVLQLPKPWRLWSCAFPNLYGLRITVAADGREDGVEGYFGVRRLTLARDRKGLAKLALNGRPVYLLGVLDQGYWPDGYLTPPSEDACRWDVDFLKDVGVNCIRKHIKVEPRCFYAHCDRVGILVMQDMPSAWRDDVAWSDAFEHGRARANTRYGFARRELKEIVDHLGNHPSVVCWIPYNEGWSQPDEAKTFAVGRWLRRYDPTRLIDLTSGWSHFEDGFVVPWLPPEKSRVRPTAEFVTDIIDCHEYPGPRISAANPHRAVICGEFGAMAGGAVDGHYTDIRGRAARFVPDTPAGLAVVRERNRRAYRAQTDRLLKQIREGSSGGILCEDVDCFWEGGGYVSFDRAIERFDRAWLREIHREMYAAYAAAWEK